MRAVGVVIVGALVVGAIGCGQIDPCGNQPGVCVSLRVEGSVKNLDQLAVTVDKPMTKTQTTAVQPLSLPLAIALGLPSGASGAVQVSVVGLARGSEIAVGAGVATIVADRAKIVVTLAAATGSGADMSLGGDGGGSDGGASGDMLGRGSLDMANCGAVSACVNGDNCCPSGCNAKSDNDCAAVCGNGVLEPGEVCDDNNTSGGDGCDPTCSWNERLELVSGVIGGFGEADGPGSVARMNTPAGITYDVSTQSMYFSDSFNAVIRKITNSGTAQVSTLTGDRWDFVQDVDGSLSQARFKAPDDVEFLNNAVYVTEDQTNRIRKIDLSLNMVSTIITGVLAYGLGQYNGLLVFYDQTNGANAGLRSYNPTSGATAIVAPATAFKAAGISQSGNCQDVACDSTYCYVACTSNVVRVTMSNGAVSNYAGSYVSGAWNTSCETVSMPLTSATFTNADRLTLVGSTLYVVDTACCDIIAVSGATAAPYAGMPGVGGATNNVTALAATFSSPLGIVGVPSGPLFVADQGNHAIRSISSTVNTYAGSPLTAGTAITTTPATTVYYETFNFKGMASDGTYVYVIEAAGDIIRLELSTGAAALLQRSTPWPVNTAFNSLVRIGTTLYTTNSNGVIQSINTDGTGAALFAGISNQTSPPSDGARLTAVMNPNMLATDGSSIFFSDNGKQIRSIDSGGMVHSLAGTSNSTDFTDGTGAQAHFVRAYALATDGSFVYVADDATGGSIPPPPTAIRRLNLTTGEVVTIAGSPTMSGHQDGPAGASLFGAVSSIVTDGRSLFINDVLGPFVASGAGLDSTVRQLDLQTMKVSTMIGLPGQETFLSGVAGNARLSYPKHMTFDVATHALFLDDEDEGVIARIK